jgi:hypothetical protein
MNKFLAFTVLTADEQAVINRYRSPANEGSVVKQVPIDQAEYLRELVKRASPGQRVRVRYRGPRYDHMRQTTLRSNAVAVSIYAD